MGTNLMDSLFPPARCPECGYDKWFKVFDARDRIPRLKIFECQRCKHRETVIKGKKKKKEERK